MEAELLNSGAWIVEGYQELRSESLNAPGHLPRPHSTLIETLIPFLRDPILGELPTSVSLLAGVSALVSK